MFYDSEAGLRGLQWTGGRPLFWPVAAGRGGPAISGGPVACRSFGWLQRSVAARRFPAARWPAALLAGYNRMPRGGFQQAATARQDIGGRKPGALRRPKITLTFSPPQHLHSDHRHHRGQQGGRQRRPHNRRRVHAPVLAAVGDHVDGY